MRILVASKFFYDRGGAEIVARRCVEAYQAAGHDVGVLTMAHPQNRDLPEAAFLAPEVSFGTPVSMALRTLGLGSVRRTMRQALREFRPDVVHFHNIHSYLSPVIVEIAKEAGCRTVWTLHDYKLLCPAYTCLRGGEVCERCAEKKTEILRGRCLRGSIVGSIMAYLEAMKWNVKKLARLTDVFICPSHFMADKMIEAGIPERKIRTVCNFVVSPEPLNDGSVTKGDYYAYFGRIAPEKGIVTLLEAAKDLPYPLRIYGNGPLEAELKRRYADYSHIEFRGYAEATTVATVMKGARLTVVPSKWYENNPLSVMESLCVGTPVVGSDIGGIPELITDGDNGKLFKSGCVDDLREAIEQTYTSTGFDCARIRQESVDRFSLARYMEQMERIFRESAAG